MLVLTSATAKAILDAITLAGPTAGPASGLFAGLFTQNVPVTPQTVLTDLTEAAYPGYARLAVVWGADLVGANGAWDVPSGALEYRSTGVVSPSELVYGLFLVVGLAGATLIAAELFSAPVGFALAGDGFTAVIQWHSDAQLGTGGTTVILPP